MQLPEINYLAVIAATVASMIVGFVFYHPKVLGTAWMRAVGHDERTVEGGSPWIYAVPLAGSFLTAWVLAGAAWLSFSFYGGSFFGNAMIGSIILFAGLTAARIVVHDAFDPRKFAATGYTLLNEALTILAMALVIGLWPPA
ncbi:DUF1761 domain-containing protein [Glutamicibacter sp. JL.03c]|uniref:DUF1761 domain-containing protein n=1 Tax=Glutamicibacter sp. JL.03c TaxID=2984842 RepID=UPI0021F6A7FC|nr:DUF1761 domain-containing protein [Glutamicibacter sp. JL.03c]UYQ77206.1 DUF1761 domain-containing protein [Glutamicibacter sp. JL.03c]